MYQSELLKCQPSMLDSLALLTLMPCSPRPANVRVVAVTRDIMAQDDTLLAGSMLRLSYQLYDASGSTVVDVSQAVLRPVLSYAANTQPPPSVNASNNQLPSCSTGSADVVSGIGSCSTAVDKAFFPASGPLDARVVVQLCIG